MDDSHLFDSLYLSLHSLNIAKSRLYVGHLAHEIGLQCLNRRLLIIDDGLGLINLFQKLLVLIVQCRLHLALEHGFKLWCHLLDMANGGHGPLFLLSSSVNSLLVEETELF